MLTIGQLAKQVGLRTSALRYYEEQGLLSPDGRTESGYRLYQPEAIQRLRLIQRAQRLGFALADIRVLLSAWDDSGLTGGSGASPTDDSGASPTGQSLIHLAESRYLALDKQVTELLTLQHELQLFLQDLHQRHEDSPSFADMLQRVCANPVGRPSARGVLDWLMAYSGCVLSSEAGQEILERLQGQHVHLWQEDGGYSILVVTKDTAVRDALVELAQLEANCQTHAETTPELVYDDEGYLLRVSGPNAFIFARLFLALENEMSER